MNPIEIKGFKRFLGVHKRILIVVCPFLLLSILVAYFTVFGKGNVDLNSVPLSSYSKVKFEDGRVYFTLNSEKGNLFKSKKNNLDAVMDFINSDPKYSKNKSLFPKNFTKNSTLIRTTSSNKSLEKKDHYFFTQLLNGIPVFGSSLIIHIKNNNEVYSINGNLTTDTKITQQKISQKEAIDKAIAEARLETNSILIARDPKQYIYNDKIVNGSEDSINHLAIGVYVDSDSTPLTFSTFYLIDMENGNIVYREDQFKEALNRTIYNCKNTISNCSMVRQEGGPVSGVADADTVYNQFSDAYFYFMQTHFRDSYNATGGPLTGYVNYFFSKPNASWNGITMQFSPGLVVADVTWHELTHAVTQYSAGLVYRYQSGAINESMSDIFGSASDNNWLIGEGISPSSGLPVPLRSMSNPPMRNNPDKLSSSLYWCSSNDSGGVHINSGVINKTFYLMTDGGSFNGCTINGIGRQRSHEIMYSVLTNYLSSSSNFYDVYTGILQACHDKFGSTSDICKEAKKATQATEIDQQPAGTQAGPKCTGVSILPATCLGAPSSSPIPDLPTSTPTTIPTVVPGQPTYTPIPSPTLASGVPTPTPTSTIPTPTKKPPFIPIGTPTPTPDQYFRCIPDPKCVSSGKSIQLCPLVCTPQ